MIRPFLLFLALLFGTGAAQAQTPFDSISQGDYGSWDFPEGDAATWGEKPASAADFGGQVVGNLHPYFLISTASQNDAPMGRAVWRGTATAPFLNLNIMGGTGPDTQVRALDERGQVIGKVSGQGNLTFKQKCIFLGFDSVGKPLTIEVVDTSPTASVALDAMSFGDKPDTIEQQKVEKIVSGFAPRLKTPGLWVSVALDGEVVAAVAYGFKRASMRAPARLTDELRIASISKAVAGTLVGLMVDKEVISYDTKIKDVFPELVGVCKPVLLEATLGQLMTHRSGRAYEAGSATEPLRPGESSSAFRYRFLQDVLNCPTNIQPGQKEIYSGGVIDALIMTEKLAKVSYDKLLRRYMVDQLGLTSLHWGTILANTAWAHNAQGLERSEPGRWSSPIPEAGGFEMNILDLAKFGSIHSECPHYGYGGFSAECFKNMQTNLKLDEGVSSTTLCGFAGFASGNLIHTGSTGMGDVSMLIPFPARRSAIALYCNYEDGSGPKDIDMIYKAISEALPRVKI